MACSISAYSGGDNRVEMNLPRFSFLGSAGLPTFGNSLMIPSICLNLKINVFFV